jgi:hypothetical protein
VAAALGLTLRAALALVLLRAAVGKLRARDGLRELADLLGATGVPSRRRRPAAVALTAAELLVAAGLAVPVTARPATAAGCALLAVLSVGVALGVRRGVRVPCRCFGASGGRLSGLHVARNGVLTLLAAAAAALALLPGGDRLPDLPTALVAGVGGLLLGELLVRWEDLAALLPAGPAVPSPTRKAKTS